MSLDPHLSDSEPISSLFPMSSSSSDSSTSSVFFGGQQHSFYVFSPKDYEGSSSGSSVSSFRQGSHSLPDLTKEVSDTYSQQSDDLDWPRASFDPTELAGTSVSLDSGIDKAGKKGSLSKVRKSISGFFKGQKKPPVFDMQSGMEDILTQQEELVQNESTQTSSKSKKSTTKPSKKTKTLSNSAPNLLSKSATKSKSSRKISETSQSEPSLSKVKIEKKSSGQSAKVKSSSTTKSLKQPLVKPKKGLTTKDISGPIFVSSTVKELDTSQAQTKLPSSASYLVLEDNLKNLWLDLETKTPTSYKAVGYDTMSSQLRDLITSAGPQTQPDAKTKRLLSGIKKILPSADIRGVLCAIVESQVGEESLIDLLEGHDASEPLTKIFQKAAKDLSLTQNDVLKVEFMDLVARSLEIKAEKIKSTLPANQQASMNNSFSQTTSLVKLLKHVNLSSWNKVLQVLTNDTVE